MFFLLKKMDRNRKRYYTNDELRSILENTDSDLSSDSDDSFIDNTFEANESDFESDNSDDLSDSSENDCNLAPDNEVGTSLSDNNEVRASTSHDHDINTERSRSTEEVSDNSVPSVNGSNNVIWSQPTIHFMPRHTIPDNRPTLSLIDLKTSTTELECFLKVFPRSLLMYISQCTNERLDILRKKIRKLLKTLTQMR